MGWPIAWEQVASAPRARERYSAKAAPVHLLVAAAAAASARSMARAQPCPSYLAAAAGPAAARRALCLPAGMEMPAGDKELLGVSFPGGGPGRGHCSPTPPGTRPG